MSKDMHHAFDIVVLAIPSLGFNLLRTQTSIGLDVCCFSSAVARDRVVAVAKKWNYWDEVRRKLSTRNRHKTNNEKQYCRNPSMRSYQSQTFRVLEITLEVFHACPKLLLRSRCASEFLYMAKNGAGFGKIPGSKQKNSTASAESFCAFK